MAIDTKTTAGGVVVLILSGTGGYLATNAITGEENTPVLSTREGRSGSEATLSPSTNENGEGRSEANSGVPQSSTTSEPQESKDTTPSQPSSEDNQVTTSPAGREEVATLPAAPSQETVLPKIKEKAKEFKFSLIEEHSEAASKWTELVSAIKKKAPTTTKEELEKFCEDNFKKDYTEESSEDFKDTVKKCTTLITLKDRAAVLNIDLIKYENETTDLSKRFSELETKSGGAKRLAEESSETVLWDSTNNSYNNLKTYCKQVEVLNWTTITVTNTHNLEREWKNFLTGCAKKADLNKDFWTGK